MPGRYGRRIGRKNGSQLPYKSQPTSKSIIEDTVHKGRAHGSPNTRVRRNPSLFFLSPLSRLTGLDALYSQLKRAREEQNCREWGDLEALAVVQLCTLFPVGTGGAFWGLAKTTELDREFQTVVKRYCVPSTGGGGYSGALELDPRLYFFGHTQPPMA